MEKKKLGRPKLNEGDKQKYQRVAIYPETYALAKSHAEDDKQNMIDWLRDAVNAYADRDESSEPAKPRKKFPFF